jgi:nucleoredoxin
MSAFTKLLGDKIIEGKKPYKELPTSGLEGKHVALYFSAHWCPPCRKFTPKLAAFYQKFQAEQKDKKLEIVFVSSDRSDDEFDEYFQTHPWKAVPFARRDIKKTLGNKYSVEGIPTLVMLDPEGNVLTTQGVEAVYANPEKLFPKRVWDSLAGKKVLDKEKKEIPIQSIQEANDVVGFYFSAHWCGPCRQFTPVLAKAYEKFRSDGKKFEIVFCSSDEDAAAFNSYFESMPWKTLPFKDSAIEELNSRYGVQGIPTLVLVDKKGNTVSSNGRALVTDDPDGFPWTGPPRALMKINGVSADHLNNGPVLVVLVDAKKEDDSYKLLEPVADAYVKTWDEKGVGDRPINFLVGGSHALVEKVKGFLNVTDLPFMAILNLPEGEKYLPAKQELSAASVKAFVDAWLAGGAGLTKKAPRE